jgi:hypothetical protein
LAQGNRVRRTNLWGWLDLLGGPLLLAVFGFWLERFQKSRDKEAERLAREEEGRRTRDEILENYYDRISALLIDKGLNTNFPCGLNCRKA